MTLCNKLPKILSSVSKMPFLKCRDIYTEGPGELASSSDDYGKFTIVISTDFVISVQILYFSKSEKVWNIHAEVPAERQGTVY